MTRKVTRTDGCIPHLLCLLDDGLRPLYDLCPVLLQLGLLLVLQQDSKQMDLTLPNTVR